MKLSFSEEAPEIVTDLQEQQVELVVTAPNVDKLIEKSKVFEDEDGPNGKLRKALRRHGITMNTIAHQLAQLLMHSEREDIRLKAVIKAAEFMGVVTEKNNQKTAPLQVIVSGDNINLANILNPRR